MNGQDAQRAIPPASTSQLYVIVSLMALAVMLMVLLHWGMGRWSFVPVLIGVLGVILRWRLADSGHSLLDRRITSVLSPLLTLILLAGLLIASEPMELAIRPRSQTQGFSLSDWLLSGAVLAFCLAQYRIQAMTLSILPEEPSGRRPDVKPVGRPAQPPKTELHSRNPQLVTPLEIGWLVSSLPIWAFLAQLCWRLVQADVRPYGFENRSDGLWRGMVLLWLIVLGVLIVAGLRSYAGQRRMREREARLFLQDAFWQETSPEQRILNRWLAWAALRRRRKEKR